MMIPRFHFTWQPSSLSPIATLVIVSALVLQGCTTPAARQPPPLDNIHILEIKVTEELPRITLELPSKGAASGAGRKAGKWAGNWALAAGIVARYGIAAGSGGGDPFVGIATVAATAAVVGGMLALTPVVATAGAVKGAFEAPSTESVESSEVQVRGILQAEGLLHRLREQVLKEVADKTSILVAGQPQARDTIVTHKETVSHSEGLQPDSSQDLEWLLYRRPKVSPGERRRSNSVLRIQLTSLELRGPYEVDPELALHLEVEVTLTTAPTGTPVYTSPFRYVTRALRLNEWVANDAKLFTEAVNLSLARLAELIVDDLFLTL